MDFPKLERKVLKLWEKEKTFEKTLKARAKAPRFVFFEGPPTANGRPGIHHALLRAYKDVVCRYKTMRGFLVERKAGWDTHGLPVEIEVEKELGLGSKSDIERYGISRFNEYCKKSVWRYKDEWEKFTERIGFWLDLKNPYITYTNEYIETLWWIFKEIWKKGLLYEGYKVVPWCTRCGSTLSSHEVAQGYEQVTEDSIYVRFPLVSGTLNLEPGTSLLVWTTTPWTLPANVAVAVHPKETYIRAKTPHGQLILAKALLKILGNDYSVEDEFPGSKLIGLTYEPPFKFFDIAENAWRVVAADFVSMEEGTGLVHIAPAFGEDDMLVGKNEGLPTVLCVNQAGNFDPNTQNPQPLSALPKEFERYRRWIGRFVKDLDPEIIEDLKSRGILWRITKHTHDYPFCWRCKTPLLYYAKKSWFIRMSRLQQKLIAANEEIHWIPDHLKAGRFGEWLRELKDWAISRERFWGTPLPIWRCQKCGETEVMGSFEELGKKSRLHNRYVFLRHGEAKSNVGNWISCWPERRKNPLTPKGRKQAHKAAELLKKYKPDLIVASPLERTRHTADIVAGILKVPLKIDPRIQEFKLGTFNTRPCDEYHTFLGFMPEGHWEKRPVGGETWHDLRRRMVAAVRSYEKKYENKTIVFVSHGDSLFVLEGALRGASQAEFSAAYVREYSQYHAPVRNASFRYPERGVPTVLPDRAMPLNDLGEPDAHRPFVDEIVFVCAKCKGTMRRVPEVADVWFDSGAMPFAQWHYPFENRRKVDGKATLRQAQGASSDAEAYPADFIVEAIDQTRGWFYTLLAIATLLGKGIPYRAVISTGHVLDKNGKKMSKSRGNIVNPWDMADRYGADSVRWYFFTVNQPGDPKLFEEKDVKTAMNRFVGTLWNMLVFYKTYSPKGRYKIPARLRLRANSLVGGQGTQYTQGTARLTILDKWILSRLQGVALELRDHMDKYDIVGSARALEQFVVDDLSNWYLRRSRERIQRPQNRAELLAAFGVFGEALRTTALLASPFTPFIAEEIMRTLGSVDSPHTFPFPEPVLGLRNEVLEKHMAAVREVSALGHAIRRQANIRVRQPLGEARIDPKLISQEAPEELFAILRDEINVKEINITKELELGKENWTHVAQDPRATLLTLISAQLASEGMMREIGRMIQDLRKDAKLKPTHVIRARLDAPDVYLAELKIREAELKRVVNARTIIIGPPQAREKFKAARTATIDGAEVFVGILR